MSGEIAVLRFSRNSQAWRQAVLRSPAAQRAREEGVILEPDWANGAKILAARVSSVDLIRERVELRPYHVILLKNDVEELKEWLSQTLSCRERPRGREEQLNGAVQQFDYEVDKTFIGPSSTRPVRSLSSVTASTQGYGSANPRRYRASTVPSTVATGGSQHSQPRTLEESAGEMKRLQRVRDIHGVLQCFSNIKRDGLIPDAYCYNIIINLFGKLKQLENAERWFEQMESEGINADANTFAVLMDACGIAESSAGVAKAEWCIVEMDRRHLVPTMSHFNILIAAHARLAKLKKELRAKELIEKAEAVFEDLLSRGLRPDVLTFSAMIDMYAQLGMPKKAEQKLNMKLQEHHMDKRDCCMMVNAYANNGHVDEAVSWHCKITELWGPDHIEVYDYTVLLKACARARPKELRRACELFREQVNAGIQPDLFNIQTLRSVGTPESLDEINQLIQELGIDTEKLKADFEAIGDEYNYDQVTLNRKLWKVKTDS